MTEPTAACPNCGSTIRFDWSHAVQTSCPFCHSVIVRGDVDLKTVGSVGDLPATSSPLQIGTTGRFQHRRFAVVGRLVYEKMLAKPDKLYGQGIGSNYQAQSLKLSKHFKG